MQTVQFQVFNKNIHEGVFMLMEYSYCYVIFCFTLSNFALFFNNDKIECITLQNHQTNEN